MFFVAVSQLVGAEAGGAQALGPTPGAWELLSPGTAVQLWGSKTSDLPQAGIGGTGGKCFQALLLGGGRRGTLLPMPLPWACAPSASWRSACPQGALAGPLKGTSPRPRHAFRLFFSFPVTVIRCSMFFSCLIVFDKELISPGQGCLFNLPLCPQCLDWYLGTGVSQ